MLRLGRQNLITLGVVVYNWTVGRLSASMISLKAIYDTVTIKTQVPLRRPPQMAIHHACFPACLSSSPTPAGDAFYCCVLG